MRTKFQENQAKRSYRILDNNASKVAASKDRRKLRRWINRVINMTRYEVKAHGLVMNTNIDTHRKQMSRLRHCTQWNVNTGRFK